MEAVEKLLRLVFVDIHGPSEKRGDAMGPVGRVKEKAGRWEIGAGRAWETPDSDKELQKIGVGNASL